MRDVWWCLERLGSCHASVLPLREHAFSVANATRTRMGEQAAPAVTNVIVQTGHTLGSIAHHIFDLRKAKQYVGFNQCQCICFVISASSSPKCDVTALAFSPSKYAMLDDSPRATTVQARKETAHTQQEENCVCLHQSQARPVVSVSSGVWQNPP